MHILHFFRSKNIPAILFLFTFFCGDIDNPFDDPENVKMTLTIPPRQDEYLWGAGDKVPVKMTVSFLFSLAVDNH